MKKNKQSDILEYIEEDKVRIINDLSMIIKQKKIKRNNVCKDIGISYTFFSEIFNMKKNPSYDTLLLISKAVGAKVRIIVEH